MFLVMFCNADENSTQCVSLPLSVDARTSLGVRRFQWCTSITDADGNSFGGFGIYTGSVSKIGVVLRMVGQTIGFVHVSRVNANLMWASYRVCNAGRYVIDPTGFSLDADGDVCSSATRLLESPFPIDVANDFANCTNRPNTWVGPSNEALTEALLLGDVGVKTRWLKALDFQPLLVNIEAWVNANVQSSSVSSNDGEKALKVQSVSFEPLLNDFDTRQATIDSKEAAHKDIVDFECTILTRRQACLIGEPLRWLFELLSARFALLRFFEQIEHASSNCSMLMLAGSTLIADPTMLREHVWRLLVDGKQVALAGASVLDTACIAQVFATNHRLRSIVSDTKELLRSRHATAAAVARVSFVDVALAHSLLFGLDLDTIRHLSSANEAAVITTIKKIC